MTLTQEVTGWIKSGCGCPMRAVVRDWGCPGCSRPVVVVEFAGLGDTTRFHGEFDNFAAARRSAIGVNAAISRTIDKVVASLKA